MDLHDWFDIKRPGLYLVRFTFASKENGFAEGESYGMVFQLLESTK